VVTSFPKELTEAYKKAFRGRNPGIKIEILNKNTTARHRLHQGTAGGPAPDVMWASAPDAFEVLARDKLLQPAPRSRTPQAPAKIGNYPLNDPEAMYLRPGAGGLRPDVEHALHGANKVPAPKEWADLVKPEYFRPCGHLVAFALGHHAPDGGDHAAGRRLGKGLGPDAADCGQLRRRHRPQLWRARRREQRPVRRRPGDRLLWPGGQVLGLPGGVSSTPT
jgi:hypothetical protein